MTRWEYLPVVPHDRVRDERLARERVERVSQVEAILDEQGEPDWEAVGFAVVARSGTAGAGHPGMILEGPKT